METDITSLGKGALPDLPDKRDFRAEFVFGATTVDWSKPLRLEEPPDENQGSSSSCVSQAWSYLHWQLRRKNYSRRDLYSRIRIDGGGAYLRDGGKELTSYGQQTRQECSDPNFQTEPNMSIHCANPELGNDDVESNYYLASDDIEGIALAVRDYQGGVFGVFGDNAGWTDLTHPTPPQDVADWAHALYAMGYHVHDGQKCIIAKSSWCFPGHHEHHIKQDYFESGRVFNAWVLIPKETLTMPIRYIVQKGGKFGILVSVDGPGIFADTILWAKSEEHFKQLKVQYEVPDNAPRLVYPA